MPHISSRRRMFGLEDSPWKICTRWRTLPAAGVHHHQIHHFDNPQDSTTNSRTSKKSRPVWVQQFLAQVYFRQFVKNENI